MEEHDKERRRYPRNIFTETIEFSSDMNGHKRFEPVLKGISINLSFSGICMYVFAPLDQGQQLKIMKGLSTNRPVLASVKWLAPIAENMFKAGLSFHV